MRTDTQRLDYVLTIVEQQDEEAADKLGAAYTLGFRGRVMVDAAMGARIIEPGQPMPELTALDLVGAELGRIRNVKGFSEERDDLYAGQELVWASIAYLTPGDERHDHGGGPEVWPWSEGRFKPSPEVWPWSEGRFKPSPDDRKKELTKGIALALCELDRLIRAERRESLELQADVCREMNEAACEPEDEDRGFKVGDRVRIARKVTEQPGWNNSWVSPEMDRVIGSSGIIEHISDFGVDVLGTSYRWPSDSLEHADD